MPIVTSLFFLGCSQLIREFQSVAQTHCIFSSVAFIVFFFVIAAVFVCLFRPRFSLYIFLVSHFLFTAASHFWPRFSPASVFFDFYFCYCRFFNLYLADRVGTGGTWI